MRVNFQGNYKAAASCRHDCELMGRDGTGTGREDQFNCTKTDDSDEGGTGGVVDGGHRNGRREQKLLSNLRMEKQQQKTMEPTNGQGPAFP